MLKQVLEVLLDVLSRKRDHTLVPKVEMIATRFLWLMPKG
jgi:hypothetical protein